MKKYSQNNSNQMPQNTIQQQQQGFQNNLQQMSPKQKQQQYNMMNSLLNKLQTPQDQQINQFMGKFKFNIGDKPDNKNVYSKDLKKGFKQEFNKSVNVRLREHTQKNRNRKRMQIVLKRKEELTKRRRCTLNDNVLQKLSTLFSSLNQNSTEDHINALYDNIKQIDDFDCEKLRNFTPAISFLLGFIKKGQFVDKCSFILFCMVNNDPKSAVNYINKDYLNYMIYVLPKVPNETRSSFMGIFNVLQDSSMNFKHCLFSHLKLLGYIENCIKSENHLLFTRATMLLLNYFKCKNNNKPIIEEKRIKQNISLVGFIWERCIKTNNFKLLFDTIATVCSCYNSIYEEFMHNRLKNNLFEAMRTSIRSDENVIRFLRDILEVNFINKRLVKDFLYFFEDIYNLFAKDTGFIKFGDRVDKLIQFICHMTRHETMAQIIYRDYSKLISVLLQKYDIMDGMVKSNIGQILINVVESFDNTQTIAVLQKQLLNPKTGKDWVCLIYDQLKNLDHYLTDNVSDVKSIIKTKKILLTFLNGVFEHPNSHLIVFFNHPRLRHPEFMKVVYNYVLDHQHEEVKNLAKKLTINVTSFLWKYTQNMNDGQKYNQVFLKWKELANKFL